MRLKDLLIRLKGKLLPRAERKTIAPRVAEKLEEQLRPIYERALEDYEKHFGEVVPEHVDIEGEGTPFPEEEPELRVVDRIAGSDRLQGLSFVEELNGLHSVVNISDAVAGDVYHVMIHEFLHTSLSQRGIDLGDEEEDIANRVALEVKREEYDE